MLSEPNEIIKQFQTSVETFFSKAEEIRDAAIKMQDSDKIYSEIAKLRQLKNEQDKSSMSYEEKLKPFEPLSSE